ncbi:hypothetical protein [Paraburkholderia sejongensis]|uniref:hypothetical protein n=1 Tax=Paraburkholderia sejongensis TaxID=2886946 RepID=UPI001E5FB1D6|nr:hypothetical protein [Paraburkholderia sp. MMS20-SJTR3]
MRIAIISSPRSGSSWVRSVLADSLDLRQIALHNYLDAPDPLPPRCIVQIHWYREPNFQRFLLENQFKCVVIGRHPLDVLLSVLEFIRHEPETSQWLLGNAGIPPELAGQPPSSDAFADYALGWGAENLLSVTYQWWHDELALRVRYEDLVKGSNEKFAALVAALTSEAPPQRLDESLERFDFSYFRSLPNQHGWQGRAGLWRQLIPARTARAIFRRHRRLFDVLGYDVPLTLTTRQQAMRNWEALS